MEKRFISGIFHFIEEMPLGRKASEHIKNAKREEKTGNPDVPVVKSR